MRFALIGAAGYIAPRHMEAIQTVGGELVAAYDLADSVGVLDKYFPECEFFTEWEHFDRHIAKRPVDFVVICSPNYLHFKHCQWALRSGADVICEKPLVIEPQHLDSLAQIEKETDHRAWAILQMRLHGELVEAKEKYGATTDASVGVEYITPRGRWYLKSWKADQQKSGGLLMNIGVHLFDGLGDIFGRFKAAHSVRISDVRSDGAVEFERARVNFLLSVRPGDLGIIGGARRTITINGETFDVSRGFTDLHTQSYAAILEGQGYGLSAARQGIEIVSALRQCAMRKAA